MSVDWYDRDGNPMRMEDFGRLKADQEYSCVGVTEMGPYFVSTVWLGLDHNFWGGPPLIFETMVFTSSAVRERMEGVPFEECEPLRDFTCERYATWDEAKKGHDEMVTL